MNILTPIVSIVLLAGLATPVFANSGQSPDASSNTINAVLDDASWLDSYGERPTQNAPEAARIRTHLRFVLDRLEKRDVSDLSRRQRTKRAAALRTLAQYIELGSFPVRSGDPYPGRRPRFIDDDGTHCAVGHLIAASGERELAADINEDFEFAYVRDIESPALFAWAVDSGFTVTELAMIQPSYGFMRDPPTEAETRLALHQATDRATLACVRKNEAPEILVLKVSAGSSGRAVATLAEPTEESTEAFATCFLQEANEALRGGGSQGEIAPYSFNLALTIPSAQSLFDKRLEAFAFSDMHCSPRPGLIPHLATMEILVNSEGRAINVTTTPTNAETEECMKTSVLRRMNGFGAGRWKLQWESTQKIQPRVNAKSLRGAVRATARPAAMQCFRTHKTNPSVGVSVGAKRNSRQFSISITASSAKFKACMKGKLQLALKNNYSVWRSIDGEQPKRYFRIDGSAKANHSFEVRTPPARRKRKKPVLRPWGK
jgi:hypothetical protein